MKIKSYNDDNYENISLIETFVNKKFKNFTRTTDGDGVNINKYRDKIGSLSGTFTTNRADIDAGIAFNKKNKFEMADLGKLDEADAAYLNLRLSDTRFIEADIWKKKYKDIVDTQQIVSKQQDNVLTNIVNKKKEEIKESFIKVLYGNNLSPKTKMDINKELDFLKNKGILNEKKMLNYLLDYTSKTELIKDLEMDVDLGLGKLAKKKKKL